MKIVFIKKNVLFSIPIFIWIFIVIVIDPFNYLKFGLKTINYSSKRAISGVLNRPLFQLLEYKNNPSPNILLGDSRANSLKTIKIRKYSGMDFANLAYGGGSINEAIITFWEAANTIELKNVYIGLNFSDYNMLLNRDRVTEALEIKNNFLTYCFSLYTFESSFLIIRHLLTKEEIILGKPSVTKEDFWKFQLNVASKEGYGTYKYPHKYFSELKKISDYCVKNRIKLIFFIPPTHVDLQNKIKEYNLQFYEENFKADLKRLGDVYDFDYPNDITRNTDNFRDPFHCNDSIGEIVVKEIFNPKENKYAKYSKFDLNNNVPN